MELIGHILLALAGAYVFFSLFFDPGGLPESYTPTLDEYSKPLKGCSHCGAPKNTLNCKYCGRS